MASTQSKALPKKKSKDELSTGKKTDRSLSKEKSKKKSNDKTTVVKRKNRLPSKEKSKDKSKDRIKSSTRKDSLSCKEKSKDKSKVRIKSSKRKDSLSSKEKSEIKVKKSKKRRETDPLYKRKDRLPHLNFSSTKEKMDFLLKHGYMVKDKLFNEMFMKKQRIDKEALAIGRHNLISKTGDLKYNSHNVKFLDHLLMSEFNIQDTSSNHNIQTEEPANRDNNNTEISNHNNTPISCEQSEIIEIDKSEDLSPNTSNNISSPTIDLTKKRKSKKKNKSKTKFDDNKLEKYNKDVLARRLSQLPNVRLSNGFVVTLTEFECDHCHKTFSSKACLRRHMYIHLGRRPYPCSHCPVTFRQKGNLNMHMRKLHPGKKIIEYVCHKCKKTFLLKENLTLHLATHIKREETYKCVFCDKVFAHHILLTQHEKQHMNPGRYKCAICTMSYDSRTRYSLHVKSHLEVKDLHCQYCGKHFLRPSSIKRHVEVFHGGIRVECPICKKKLKGHLTEHIRTHQNQRPHECDICGQRFTQSTQLNVHKRSHSGVRPYPCKICKQPFTNSNALMLHIRRHTGEKPFPCAMCPLSFSQLPHMKCHMQRIHGKEKFYKCTKCKKFFRLKNELELHEDTCKAVDEELTFEQQVQASLKNNGEPSMNISKMRFLLALLFTMIAPKEKLKYLGFNKRLIDDILMEAVEAMGHKPCKTKGLSPLMRLKNNIAMLLHGTVPKEQMAEFVKSKKTTEELLELLTGEKNRSDGARLRLMSV